MSIDRPHLPDNPLLWEDGAPLRDELFNGNPMREIEAWSSGRVGRSPETASYAPSAQFDQIAGDQSIRGYNFRANAFSDVHSLQVEDYFSITIDGHKYANAHEPSPMPGSSLRFHCREEPESVFCYYKAIVHAQSGNLLRGHAHVIMRVNQRTDHANTLGCSGLAPQGWPSKLPKHFMTVGTCGRGIVNKGWNEVTGQLWDNAYLGGSTQSGHYVIGASDLFIIVTYRYS